MSYNSNYDTVGRYTPTEPSLIVHARNVVTPKSARKAIIVLHGADASPLMWSPGSLFGTTPVGDHLQALAEAGYYCICPDAGGSATWLNDTAMTAITAAYNYLIAQGIKGTKVGIFAHSMGGGNALQWTKSNTTKVVGIRAHAPVTNLDYFQGLGGSFTTQVNAAYGGNYAANSVGHKIFDEYATWRGVCPISIVHGSADVIVPPAQSVAFIAGVADTRVTEIVKTGADHVTSFAAQYTPPSETVAFFDGLTW